LSLCDGSASRASQFDVIGCCQNRRSNSNFQRLRKARPFLVRLPVLALSEGAAGLSLEVSFQDFLL
jgi:hypothetical protein